MAIQVSYRIGEKGQIKLLMSEKRGGGMFNSSIANNASMASTDDLALELEKEGARAALAMSSGFNPEAQAFKPAIDTLATSMSALRVGSGSPTAGQAPLVSPAAILASPPKPTVTFTTAAFAQTKFGSTKLKNSSKRPNRMSPTEFSHYIKQRALIQQQQKMKFMGSGMGGPMVGMNGSGMGMAPNSPPHHMRSHQFPMGGGMANGGGGLFSRPRSLSPLSLNELAGQTSTSPLSYNLGDLKSAPVPAGISPFPDTTGLWQPPTDLLGGLNSSGSSSGSVSPPPLISLPPLQPAPTSNFGNGGFNGFGMDQGGNNGGILGDLDAGFSLGALANYSGNNPNYQHLLVAN